MPRGRAPRSWSTPQPRRRDEQRGLGGIAQRRRRCATSGAASLHRTPARSSSSTSRCARGRDVLAGGEVDGSLRCPQRLHGHLVAGQRARLVRGDDGGAAERLDRRQVADDRPPARHALDADGKRDGHDRGQALGHGRDRQADAGQGRVGQPRSRGPPPRPASATAATPIAIVIARPTRSSSRVSGVASMLGLVQQGGDAAQLGRRAGGDRDDRGPSRRRRPFRRRARCGARRAAQPRAPVRRACPPAPTRR